MGKLTPSFRNVLAVLALVPESFVIASHLPDGNGMMGRVNGAKLKSMKEKGLIEYGKNHPQMLYGYRITEAGHTALTSGQEK